jgi:putative tricarboxylic transport membrane protein
MVLALVLGDKAEDAFRQSMLASQGDLGILWSNPLVGSITTLAMLMLFWPLIARFVARLWAPRVDEFEAKRPVD